MQVTTWGKSKYEWGWEVRIDITDEDGRIFNYCYGWKHEPTEEDISEAVKQQLSYTEFIKEEEANRQQPVEEII